LESIARARRARPHLHLRLRRHQTPAPRGTWRSPARWLASRSPGWSCARRATAAIRPPSRRR